MLIKLKTFVADDNGSATVEFVVVFPLLMFITTNGLAFWDAFQSNSKTAKVAYTISDIMSRYDVVGPTETAYLFALQNKMLPLDLTQQTMWITSICFEDGLYRVMWSYTAGTEDIDAPEPMTGETIPTALMPTIAPQDSVILTEIAAHWEPHLHVGVQPMTWRSALVNHPAVHEDDPAHRPQRLQHLPGGAPADNLSGGEGLTERFNVKGV